MRAYSSIAAHSVVARIVWLSWIPLPLRHGKHLCLTFVFADGEGELFLTSVFTDCRGEFCLISVFAGQGGLGSGCCQGSRGHPAERVVGKEGSALRRLHLCTMVRRLNLCTAVCRLRLCTMVCPSVLCIMVN